MRSLIAFGLVAGLANSAHARPFDHDRPPPPSMMRGEVQMRMPVDGRGETQSFVRDAKPEPWQKAERPQAQPAPTAQKPQLPIKTDVALKMQNGDGREPTAAKSVAKDASAQAPVREARTMTPHDREMLCKMAGVCLPASHASDDVEDKTE